MHPLGSVGPSVAQWPGLCPLMEEQELMQPEQWVKSVSHKWDLFPYVWCTSHMG